MWLIFVNVIKEKLEHTELQLNKQRSLWKDFRMKFRLGRDCNFCCPKLLSSSRVGYPRDLVISADLFLNIGTFLKERIQWEFLKYGNWRTLAYFRINCT